MRVIFNPTGETGDIPDNMFDPQQFTQVPDDTASNTGTAPPVDQQAKSSMLDSLKQSFDPANLRSLVRTPFSLLGSVDDLIKYNTGDAQAQQQAQQSYQQHSQDLINTEKMFGFGAPGSGAAGKGSIGEFNPGQFAKKELAGASEAASYAVPYGQGGTIASRALVPGALQGVLKEVAQDNPTLEGGAKKAVVGAITAGALDTAEQALSKILHAGGNAAEGVSDMGSSLEKNVINPKVSPNDPFGYEKEQQIVDTLHNLGFKGSAQDMRAQMPGVFRDIQGQITKQFSQSTNTLSRDELNNIVDTAVKQGVNYNAADPIYNGAIDRFKGIVNSNGNGAGKTIEDMASVNNGWQRGIKQAFDSALSSGDKEKVGELISQVPEAYQQQFADKIEGVMGKPLSEITSPYFGNSPVTPQTIYQIKHQVGDIASNAFKKMANPASAPLTPNEEVAISTWGGLQKALEKVSPETNNLTKTESILYKAAPGLYKSANEAGPAIEALGTKIPLPGNVIQKGEDLLGRAVSGGAGAVAGGLNAAGNVASNPAVEQALQQVVGHAATGGVGNKPSSQGGIPLDSVIRAGNNALQPQTVNAAENTGNVLGTTDPQVDQSRQLAVNALIQKGVYDPSSLLNALNSSTGSQQGGGFDINEVLQRMQMSPNAVGAAAPKSTQGLGSGPSDSTNSSMNMGTSDQGLPPVDQLITRDEATQLMMQDMAQSGGRHIDQIKALYDFANPTGGNGKMNQTAMSQLMQVAQANDMLNRVEKGMGNVGMTGPIGGLITKATTSLNPEAAALSPDREAMAHNVARALYSDATGRINENDITRALQLIPDITDSAPVRAAKLRDLRSMLADKQQILTMYPDAVSNGVSLSDLGSLNNTNSLQ